MDKDLFCSQLRQWFTLENAVFLSIFLFFTLAFNLRHSTNSILMFLLILGIGQQISRLKKRLPWVLDKTAIQVLLTFSALPAVIGLQVLWFPSVTIKQLDAALRFIASGLVLLFLLTSMDYRKLSLSCYGCILGTLGMAYWGWLSTHDLAYAFDLNLARGSNNFINPIEFGSFAITLGFISLILPLPENSSKQLHYLLFFLKIMGFIFGMIAALYSGSRAAFAAWPLLLALFLFHKKKYTTIKRIGIVSFIVLVTVIILTQTSIYRRINEGIQDITIYHTNKNTSLGARFQMWSTAIQLFLENPILGVGRRNYSLFLEKRVQQGIAPEFLTQFNNAHNEYLNTAAELGLLGVLSLMLLLFIPGLFFYKNYRSNMPMTNFAATAGLTIVVSHAIFFSFNSLLLMSCQTTFYSFSVVLFMAIILNEQTTRMSSLSNHT
jgi:O-antigen ligase